MVLRYIIWQKSYGQLKKYAISGKIDIDQWLKWDKIVIWATGITTATTKIAIERGLMAENDDMGMN